MTTPRARAWQWVAVVVLALLPGGVACRCGEAPKPGADLNPSDPIFDFEQWRQGKVVAEAEFDPGIAPFKVVVRRVPVPVTQSEHYIVALYRGQYVVTAQRYFWPGHTPQTVKISWPCLEKFTVTFDGSRVATCEWSWGRGATWGLEESSAPRAGLSGYFFTPRKPVPEGCALDRTGIE